MSDFSPRRLGGRAPAVVATALVFALTARVSVPAFAADEIHWTFTSQTSVALDWRGSESSVRYGLTSAYGSTVEAAHPSIAPYSSSGPFWEARIAGLLENTEYHYSIGGGPDHLFRTPPPRGASGFTVFAVGDIGETQTYPNVGGVMDQIAAGDPSFVIMLGDLTYANAHGQFAVDLHFNDVMRWSQDAAYMPIWGNHEWDKSTDDLRNYKGRFDLPNPRTSPGSPSVSCCGEDWYWFDYGNVRFIGLPEPWSGAYADWKPRADSLMNQVDQDPAIDFIITFGHRPSFSSGHHPGDSKLAGYLNALGDAHPKYVLDLCGHSHDYERSHPQHGVIHVTAGGGGSTLETESGSCPWLGGCPAPSWSAFRAFHHGPLRLRISRGFIQADAICGPSSKYDDTTCTPGVPMDSFTIGTPTAADLVAPAASRDLRMR